MSPFLGEALFIGIKEGIKLSLCLFLAFSYFRRTGFDPLKKPLIAGVATVFLASFAAMAVPVTVEVRDVVVKLIGYVFGLFYLFSLGVLFQATGTDMLGPLKGLFNKRLFLSSLVYFLTVVYFVPDMAGSSLYIKDLYSMAGGRAAIFGAAGAGFALSLFVLSLGARKSKADVTRLFDLPQILLFLALIKLVAGGVRGFAELSLIPSVQAGLMKLVHDMVHQVLVLVLIPDHPILSVTTWNFIGALFRETAGRWLSLLILTLPLILFIRKHFAQGVVVPSGMPTSARKRLFVKAVRDQRILKSVPVFLFLVFILSVWFVQERQSTVASYKPDPKPVAAEGGRVIVPLQRPAEDLRDGMLHKFSLTVNGENLRLLIVKKSDGTLAVCLDACEICPPDGYGQRGDHVVCLYCNTPIPVDTLGKPGGCNPIPLQTLVTDKEVVVEVSEIMEKWTAVKTSQTRETVNK